MSETNITFSQFFARIFGRQDASNQKKDDNPDDFFSPITAALGAKTKQPSGENAIADANVTPEGVDEENVQSVFQDYITRKGKLFNKEKNNWKLFAIESISYSVLVLVIGIIGGNLENISNLTDPDKKGNSYLLRNKFEGLFKHSLSARDQLKIDESIYKDSSIPIDLRVWCSLCDLSVQAKLLLQSWPLKIFDYGNWLMCELTWNAFDNFFTKGKAFKAYFIPILLIIIIYFQIPLIIGFLVALLGSTFHPNFPIYWLGVFAYLSYIKSVVRTAFTFIIRDIPCTKLLAYPRPKYVDKRDCQLDRALRGDLFTYLDELEEDGDHFENKNKREAIGKLLEIIKSTPCTMDGYNIQGQKIDIKSAKCIDMNIDFNVGSVFFYGDDKSDITSFKSLVANLISRDCEDISGNSLYKYFTTTGRARRLRTDKFKYFVNPFCIADVKYIDDNVVLGAVAAANYGPADLHDPKFWLWSKTTQRDRGIMYKKLRDAIEDDYNGYFGTLGKNPGRSGGGKGKLVEIINMVQELDEHWHENGADGGAASELKNRVNQRVERLRDNFKKKLKTNKVRRGIIMATIRLSALLFIIYKAFDIGYSKHLYVDIPKKQKNIEAATAEQSGGRRSKSGGAPKPFAKMRAKAGALGKKFSDTKTSVSNFAERQNAAADRAVATAGNTETALFAKEALRSERGANIRNSGAAAMLGVKDDDDTILSKFINLMNSALEFCGNMAGTKFSGSKLAMIPEALIILIGVLGSLAGHIIYFIILVVAMLFSTLTKIAKYLFITLPSQTKEMIADDDQRNILYNFVMTLIKLIPFVVVFNVVGLWFAPIYGLAACIAFAIFVQFKFISFTLFGTKDSQFIKKHIKENRLGLTLLASIMITFSSAKNLKPQTAFGVALASVICMLILACGV